MRNNHQNRMQLATLALVAAALLSWNSGVKAGGYSSGYYKPEVRYTGRATVIDATAKALTSTTRFVQADTGEQDFSGATREDTVLTFDNPAPLDIHAKVLTAVTGGANNTSASSAAISRLLVNLPGLQIKADVVESEASATCHRSSQTVSTAGSSSLVNLTINGNPVTVKGTPNQTITVPGVATVIIDEQFNPDVNTKVVNALHVKVPGAPGVASADIVLSHSKAGIFTCPCEGTGTGTTY